MITLLEWLKNLNAAQLRIFMSDNNLTESDAYSFTSKVNAYGLIVFEKLSPERQKNLIQSFLSIIK